MSRRWYGYVGPDGPPHESTTGNYTPIAGNFNCAGGSHLCAVYAIDGGDQPVFISTRLATYFSIAKVTNGLYPDGPGEKPYVYTRPL